MTNSVQVILGFMEVFEGFLAPIMRRQIPVTLQLLSTFLDKLSAIPA
jgi:hypothetical protein